MRRIRITAVTTIEIYFVVTCIGQGPSIKMLWAGLCRALAINNNELELYSIRAINLATFLAACARAGC